MSRHNTIFFIILPVLLIFAPVLFFGKIFLDGDTTSYTYPFGYFYQHYPGVAWNPFIFSGFPVTPLFHFGFFHPVYQLMYRLLDFLTAYHLILFAGVLLSSSATYLFARAQGISKEGSVVVATAYTFSQWSIAWIASSNLTSALYLLPVLFFAIHKVVYGKRWFALLFGGAIGVALLGTHYQYVAFATGASLVYGIWLLYLQHKEGINVSHIRNSLIIIILGFVLGILIGTPQLLATSKFFALSGRAGSFAFASPSILSFVKYLLPNFNIPYVSGSDELYPYIGVLAFMFGIIGFRYCFLKNNSVRFFGFLLVFSILVMLPFSPLFWLIRHLPIMDHFGMAARWVYLANFALALLAGFGFDFCIGENQINFIRVRRWLWRLIMFFFIGTVIANVLYFVFGPTVVKLVQDYFDKYRYAETIGLPLSYYHALIVTLLDKAFYNMSIWNPQLLVLFGSLLYLWAVVCAYLMKTLTPQKLGEFLAFGIVANSLLFAIPSLTLADKAVLLSKPEVVTYLEMKEQRPFNFRVYSFMIPFTLYEKITALHPTALVAASDFMREGLVPNVNMFFELPVAGGYEPMATKKMQDLLKQVELPSAHISIPERIKNFEDNLSILSDLNVKYIVSPYQLTETRLKLLRKFIVTEYKIPLCLYENTSVVPRFSFTPGGVEESIMVLLHRPDEEILSVNSATETELVRSEVFLPGWRATIDGVGTPIRVAKGVLQSIHVPPGKHTIRFFFTPNP